jgi:hypothetical protein
MLNSQRSFKFGLLLNNGFTFCPSIDSGITYALYQKIEIFLSKLEGLHNTLFQFQSHLILSLLRQGAYTSSSRSHEETTNGTLDRITRKESIEFIERTNLLSKKIINFTRQIERGLSLQESQIKNVSQKAIGGVMLKP